MNYGADFSLYEGNFVFGLQIASLDDIPKIFIEKAMFGFKNSQGAF